MPNRILKESIRTSKSINALSDFQFRLWAYLITYVDDFGRGSAEPDILKGFVFPRRKSVTEATINAALLDLANIGLIRLYEVDGDSYLCLRNWEEHQTPRAKLSKFPAPPEVDDECSQPQADDSTCEHMQADASRCSQMQADAPDIRYSIIDKRYTIFDNDQVRENETGFDEFWKAYPRKVSKQSALKAWKGAKADKLAEQIIADVQRRCETEWKGQEMQYIPFPTTYLHQRRWEDETAPQERRATQKPESKQNAALNYEQRTYDDDEFQSGDYMREAEEFMKQHNATN